MLAVLLHPARAMKCGLLFAAVRKRQAYDRLMATLAERDRKIAERSASVHEAWELVRAQRPHCPVEWLPPGVPMTFHTFTGRLRLRAPWPAAQWIRT